MDIETRVTNLENLVGSLVTMMNNQKFYTDADINGVRQSVNEITPYTETKTAYIDDTEITFKGVPNGNLTVYFDNAYTLERDGDMVTVKFEALDEVKPITISII